MLSLIYARSRNHCIGSQGRLPWHLPEEFSHFEKTTQGRPVIMGRLTYEDQESALPGCLNIVVSRRSGYETAAGVELVHSLDEAVALAKTASENFFVIGGAALLSEALPSAGQVYETVVSADIPGDTFIARFDFSAWNTSLVSSHPADERHAFPFTVYRHRRPG